MRKHISLYYKSFDGTKCSEMDRKINECFNEYGYNMESNRRKTVTLDETSCKTGPNCLNRRQNQVKK